MMISLNVSYFAQHAHPEDFPCSQLDGAWQARVALKQTESEIFERTRRFSDDIDEELRKNDNIYSSYLRYLLSESGRRAPCDINDPIILLSNMIPPPGSNDNAVQALVALLNDPKFEISTLFELEPIVGRHDRLQQEWIEIFGVFPNAYIVTLLTEKRPGKREQELSAFFRLVRNSDGYFAQEAYDKLEQSLMADPEWFLDNQSISRKFLLEDKRLASSINVGTVEIGELAAVYRSYLTNPLAVEIVNLLDLLIQKDEENP